MIVTDRVVLIYAIDVEDGCDVPFLYSLEVYKVFEISGHVEVVIESFKRNTGEYRLIDDILASSPIYLLDSPLRINFFLPTDGPSNVHLSFTGFTLTDIGIVNFIKVEANIECICMQC